MDHFQLGRAAFEARQFAEADTHFKRAASASVDGELAALREFQYLCAKVLRPTSCWREFYVFAQLRAQHSSPSELLELLHAEEIHVPSLHKAVFYELQAQALFLLGALSRSREIAKLHVELLLEKKLTPHLLASTRKYESWFPQSVYFQFVHLQALVLLEDIAAAGTQFRSICKTVQRRWRKIEDKTEDTKTSLLLATAESANGLDRLNGEATILHHKALLQSYVASETKLAKEDWKKLAELIVHEDSWDNLKLVLELAILQDEKAIALECYNALKRKRGFSFVKLTKNSEHLRVWLLAHANVRPVLSSEGQASSGISSEDLELEGSTAPTESAQQEPEDNPELRAVELNTIKQLGILGPGPELVPDLLVAYRTMGFHRVVSWLLQVHSMTVLDGELRRKIQYFKVLHAVDRSETYLALAQIEEMLGDEQLGLDEYKELKYAQGCLLMTVKRFAEARAAFAAVAKVDPTYRQTRERMGLLAQD
jgi:hypothetical protein